MTEVNINVTETVKVLVSDWVIPSSVFLSFPHSRWSQFDESVRERNLVASKREKKDKKKEYEKKK